MPNYRSPDTAPRDGTIIRGLFERRGKRARAFAAAFNVDAANVDAADQAWPQWQREMAERHNAMVKNDPVAFFRPLSDSDAAIDVGRMIGWKPVSSHH